MAAQQQFMRAAGCDLMQGYYFARPMPAEQLSALLQEHAAFQQQLQPACAA